MRPVLRRLAVAAAAGVVLAVATLLFGVDRKDLVMDALLVYLAGLLALTVARISTAVLPPPRAVVTRALARRPPQASPPESLVRTDGLVALAQASSLDFHVRLRPLLVRVAAVAYAARAGLQQEELPAESQAAFSAETWELIRPDRPRPEGPDEHGIPTPALSTVLDELESILPP